MNLFNTLGHRSGVSLMIRSVYYMFGGQTGYACKPRVSVMKQQTVKRAELEKGRPGLGVH